MVGGELHAIAAGGAELEGFLDAGGECAFGGVDFLAVKIGDDAGGQVNHLVDATPDSAGGEDAGVAGDAGIGGADRAGARAGVPFVDGVIVLDARVGAAPGRE